MMRLIVGKLDQTLFNNIEVSWTTDVKYCGCTSFDLFFKIIEAEYNSFVSTVKGKAFLQDVKEGKSGSPTAMNDINQMYLSSVSSSFSQSVNKPYVQNASVSSYAGGGNQRDRKIEVQEFDALPKCIVHAKYAAGASSIQCQRGNDCKFAHWSDTRFKNGIWTPTQSISRAAKAAYEKSQSSNKRPFTPNQPSRAEALNTFKQLKNAEGGRTINGKANVHLVDEVNEEEFNAFLTELWNTPDDDFNDGSEQ